MRSILDFVLLGHVREFDVQGIGVAQGATNTAMWLAGRQRIGVGAARRWVRVAAALDRHAALHTSDSDPEPADPDDGFVLPDGVRSARDALAAGVLNLEQAEAISRAVNKLPVQYRAEAETLLIGDAQRVGPVDLTWLGGYILHRIDPEKAEALEAEALLRNEKRAYANRQLHLKRQPDGSLRIYGSFDPVDAAIIGAAIEAQCSPRTHRGDNLADQSDSRSDSGSANAEDRVEDGEEHDDDRLDKRSYPQRCADAMTNACRLALNTEELPAHGGDRPQVIVTMDLDDLRNSTGTAMLEDGVPISATQARLFACDCGVIPAVLGGKGQPLDIGRERRLFTGPLRRALVLRDGGCSFPGCDRPPRWTDGHHALHWVDGGKTCLGNGILACWFHHRLLHEGDWEVRLNPIDGRPDFIPPTYVDSQRRPRRNLCHRRA